MAVREYDQEPRMPGGRTGDLVLAQGEYALLQDGTNGNVQVIVGPNKTSVAETDSPVIYDHENRKFLRVSKQEAICQEVAAKEGQYIVLHNPVAKSAEKEHPTRGASDAVSLQQGCKVVIPGPANFALFPGQHAELIDGHQLRSNQYLVVRVYNDKEARKNWGEAVVKAATDGTDDTKAKKAIDARIKDLTTGRLINITGSDVSFYILPTGVEVVPDKDGSLIRDAVTLQRLTYAILLGEDGEKRYVKGPAVVIPDPTEKFVLQNKSPKYKALELNENMGLYIKVIAEYEEEGKSYKAGDELFITGNEMRIYYPRPEHALIRYGQDLIHYAIAIPKGEARYVLNKANGGVTLIKGPKMYLPDPRKEVIVRKALDPKTCQLWFPGNSEAVAANHKLLEEYELARSMNDDDDDYDVNEAVLSKTLERNARDIYGSSLMNMERFASDKMTRNRNFTPPRTITLNTKYEGAVAINIWTGYAVQIVDKAGNRRVVVGPTTVLLEYDESLEVTKLSRGCPKSTQDLLKTVYLRVTNNKITDYVEAETSDLVKVGLTLSYTVNFEDKPEKWYDVENYVKYLTDHMRSMIRNAVTKVDIETFNAGSIDIIRDIVLGAATEKGRTGRAFGENGMRICDVDVLNIQIGDRSIAEQLIKAQHDAVRETLMLKSEKRRLTQASQIEVIKQQIATLQAVTTAKQAEIELQVLADQKKLSDAKLAIDVDSQEALDAIAAAKLARVMKVISNG